VTVIVTAIELPSFGGLDLSPLAAVLLIGLLSSFALGLLAGH